MTEGTPVEKRNGGALHDIAELSVVPVGWIRSEWGFYLTLRAAKCEDVERRGVLRSAAAAVMQGVSE